MAKKSRITALEYGKAIAKEENGKTNNLAISEGKASHSCDVQYPFVQKPEENLSCKCGVDQTLFPASAEMIKQKKQQDFASCREAKKLSQRKK